MKNLIQQQGDLLIFKISKLPEGVNKVERKERGYVLAEGEATGHAHTIEDDVEMYEKNGVLYLKADKKVKLRHEEHKVQIIEPGVYEIGRVQEFDHFAEKARRVAD